MAEVIKIGGLNDHLLGDFSQSETNFRGDKKPKSEILDKNIIQNIYVPLVREFKEQLAGAKSQEEFDNTILNFMSEKKAEFDKDVKDFLEKNLKNSKKRNPTLEDIEFDKLDKGNKIFFQLLKDTENMYKNDRNVMDLALRKSTYIYGEEKELGSFGNGNITKYLIDTDLPKFIENSQILKMPVTELNPDGTEKTYKKFIMKNGQKTDEFTLETSSYKPIDYIQTAIMKEVLEELNTQYSKQAEKTIIPDNENYKKLLSPYSDVIFKDDEATKEKANTLKQKIAEAMPTVEWNNFYTTKAVAKLVALNPNELLTKNQLNNEKFVHSMILATPSCIKELSDDFVKKESTQKVIENALVYLKADEKNTNKINLAEDLENYARAVKEGKKAEYLKANEAKFAPKEEEQKIEVESSKSPIEIYKEQLKAKEKENLPKDKEKVAELEKKEEKKIEKEPEL